MWMMVKDIQEEKMDVYVVYLKNPTRIQTVRTENEALALIGSPNTHKQADADHYEAWFGSNDQHVLKGTEQQFVWSDEVLYWDEHICRYMSKDKGHVGYAVKESRYERGF